MSTKTNAILIHRNKFLTFLLINDCIVFSIGVISGFYKNKKGISVKGFVLFFKSLVKLIWQKKIISKLFLKLKWSTENIKYLEFESDTLNN